MSERDFVLVTTPAELESVARQLDGCQFHALDTESNSGFAYKERLCLLQLNIDSTLVLVDLVRLATSGGTMEPLRGPLEDPERATWLHGGEFDVGCMKRDFGIHLKGIWDTQQAASYLEWPKTGYGALVERVCGVTLPKGHSLFDWSRRPLDSQALAYALDDVRYLPRVREHLAVAVEQAGIAEEVEMAGRAVEAAEWSGAFQPDGFWKIKGASKLPPGAIPALVSLWHFREQEAERLNLPPGRVLNNQLLLALARAAPGDTAALRRLGVRGRRSAESGSGVLDAIRSASTDPPAVPPAPARQPRVPGQKSRAERLKQWRRKEAERRGVSLQVVLATRSLEYLALHGAADLDAVPLLGASRLGRYGDQLLELCRP